MDPHKILKHDHPFFCEKVYNLYLTHPLAKDLRSFKDVIRVLKENKEEAIEYLGGDEREFNNWIRRAAYAPGIFELAILGGDLEATDEWRVLNGRPVFHGSKDECMNYIHGGDLQFIKEGSLVSKDEEYDGVVDEEGRVLSSIEEARKDCILERRYYDAVEDVEIWHSES